MMGKHVLLLFIFPLIYTFTYGQYCYKKGETLTAIGVFIAVIIPMILMGLMFYFNLGL